MDQQYFDDLPVPKMGISIAIFYRLPEAEFP